MSSAGHDSRVEGYWDDDDNVFVLQAIGAHVWVAAEPGSFVAVEDVR